MQKKPLPLTPLFIFLVALASLTGSAVASADSPPPQEGRLFELPRSPGEGESKEVKVLLDEPHLKLATITLRDATALPSHSAPVPSTIQVLEGEGVIHVGAEAVAVSAGSIIVLEAGAEHDVVPAEGGAMVLLVHYLRGGSEEVAAHSGHDH